MVNLLRTSFVRICENNERFGIQEKYCTSLKKNNELNRSITLQTISDSIYHIQILVFQAILKYLEYSKSTAQRVSVPGLRAPRQPDPALVACATTTEPI